MALLPTEKTWGKNNKEIKYLNRDFASLRQSLIDFTRTYYADTFNDIMKLGVGNLGRRAFNLSAMCKELDDYRIKNTYSRILQAKLDIELITNSVNGGRNVERFMDLDFIIDFIEKDSSIRPRYLIFQLTHVGRDIEDMLLQNTFTVDYLYKIYGDAFICKVISAAEGKKTAWKLDNLFDETTKIFIEKLENRFKNLEQKYNTKCIFFFGLGDVPLIEKHYRYYKSSPYFMEIIYNDVLYYTWLEMNQKLNLTISDQTGIPDEHPSSVSNKIISEILYKRLKS